jgi:hypothetical protein
VCVEVTNRNIQIPTVFLAHEFETRLLNKEETIFYGVWEYAEKRNYVLHQIKVKLNNLAILTLLDVEYCVHIYK